MLSRAGELHQLVTEGDRLREIDTKWAPCVLAQTADALGLVTLSRSV